jgi:REP element-mobilizing transposase RayT
MIKDCIMEKIKLNFEDNHIYKNYNKSLLLYHLVFFIKYRRSIITEDIENHIRDICLGIANGYEVRFVEIGFDENHIHLLIQSVPSYSITSIVKILKSIIARETFRVYPEIKKNYMVETFGPAVFM